MTPDADRRHHRDVLILCAIVVALSLVLNVGADGERVAPLGLTSLRLPGLCPLRNLTGLPCPGCGLTRSFIATAHADLTAAFGFHRLGPLLFAALAAQLPYRLARLLAGRRDSGSRRNWAPWLTTNRVVAVIIGGMLANWLVDMVARLWTFIAEG
jgi:hypothetical protein